jgi:2-C-methyl-D-erythritol 4-phosphate cytidylyltransferase/2-C-methyl-D-erythritol 2,4-cyclodiphosphate synthase
MLSDPPKQFRLLGGRPLLDWSLDLVLRAGCAQVILVVPEDLVDAAHAVVHGRPGVHVTSGGSTRRLSVAAGLDRVSADVVVVHDAVRPFATVDLVDRTVAALDIADAAVPALPLEDTVKEVDASLVTTTIDRARLWRVQTPQAFRADALRAAHALADRQGLEATDDAQLVERNGGRVAVVEGTRSNMKLTYPEDFAIAEAIARSWS